METNQIKELSLSIEDFDLIMEGLDSIPSKKLSSDMFMFLMEGLITKGDPEMQAKLDAERKQKEAKEKREQEIQKENLMILKAKILSLKRVFEQNKLLSDYKALI